MTRRYIIIGELSTLPRDGKVDYLSKESTLWNSEEKTIEDISKVCFMCHVGLYTLGEL
jgi:hypothetical protein